MNLRLKYALQTDGRLFEPLMWGGLRGFRRLWGKPACAKRRVPVDRGIEPEMLKSLFGDLSSFAPRRASEGPDADFASTEILEELLDEERSSTQPPAEPAAQDIFVTGSAVQAMRAHLSQHRASSTGRQRVIALFDPTRIWASAVVKALSDASGHALERLQLREQSTLEVLAEIERTTLPRRADEVLKVYHADVSSARSDLLQLPLVLLEQADLACVIIGPMAPSAVDALLHTLQQAARTAHWSCPRMLFLLPVGAVWIANKLDAMAWPESVDVETLCEPLTSASAVWNQLLAHWNRAGSPQHTAPGPLFSPSGTLPLSDSTTVASSAAPASPTLLFTGGTALTSPTTSGSGTSPSGPSAPDPERARVVLRELELLDGLVFAALVEAATGTVVASGSVGPDINRAAAAAAELLAQHRRSLRQMGHTRPDEPVDEILVTAGNRYHILRGLSSRPNFFILAVLDKLRSNLAMTRFRIMEAQQVLN
jgi:hypothetical protein